MRSERRPRVTRPRRWRRRLGWAAGCLGLLLFVGWGALHSDWARERIRRAILSAANGNLSARLDIGRVDGSIFGNLTLHDVRLTKDAAPVLIADAIAVQFDPFVLMREGWQIAGVTLVHPRLFLVQAGDGWNVARLGRAGPSTRSPAFAIRDLSVENGEVEIDPLGGVTRRAMGVDLDARLAIADGRVSIGVDGFTAVDRETGLQITGLTTDLTAGTQRLVIDETHLSTNAGTASGRAAVPLSGGDEPAFDVSVSGLAVDRWRAYVPAFEAIPAGTAIDGSITGTSGGFDATWTIQSGDGRVSGSTHGAVKAGQFELSGAADISGVRPSAWAPELRELSELDAAGTYDVSGPINAPAEAVVSFDVAFDRIRYTGYRINGARASGSYAKQHLESRVEATAYGAGVTAHVRADATTGRVEAGGHFSDVDARLLPAVWGAPAVETRLAGAFKLTVADDGWAASATFSEAVAAGATIAAGSRIDVRHDAAGLHYDARAELTGLNPANLAPALPDEADTLARWPGRLNAVVTVNGNGMTRDVFEGQADVEVSDATLPGIVVPALCLSARVQDHRLEASLDGEMDVDIGRLGPGGIPQLDDLSGPAGVAATVMLPDIREAVRLEDLEATAAVVRHASGFDDRSRLDAAVSMSAGAVEVRRFDVSIPALTATASGRIAVAGSAESNLALTVAASDLSVIARQSPGAPQGRATISARVAGTSARPVVAGTWDATALERGSARIANAAGDFAAELPDFDWTNAIGRTTVRGTLVQFGEWRFDHLAGDVAYFGGKRIRAEATLTEGNRALELAGTARFRDNVTDIEVDRLRIAANGKAWSLAGDGAATAQLSDQSLSLTPLTLADDGAGRVRIEGGLGANAAASSLTVRAEGIDLSVVSAWIPSADLTGRLDATATATGTVSKPEVTGNVVVDGGTVNGARFRRLDAHGGYAAGRLAVDATLEAVDGSRFTANGSLPVASATEAGPWDLRIENTGVDLAFLQPVVPGVADLRGQGLFDIRLTGSEPAVAGSITASGVSFRVPATGVRYRNVAVSLEAAGHDLTVREFRVEDTDGHVARIEGLLSVPGIGPPDQFDLRFVADDFSVLNNDLGLASVSTDLQIMGSLDTPLVAGTLRVDRGRLELDRWLQRLRNAYAPAVEAGASETSASTSPFSRSSLSIALDMPDNVVARGRDLRTRGGGPIGLGDINVTIGGALVIAKEVGDPVEILGPLRVVRGEYRFQGRSFAIARGSEVRFRGNPANPEFDVTAERTISGVVATVHVNGTPARPVVGLSSQPPLDEGDILSLIVFNQAMNRLGSAARVSLAARAGALAAGAIATPITSSVARALDLDQFDVRPSDTGRGASLVVGRQVNDRLFVGFRQDFGRGDASEVTIELRLTEYLSLVTSLAQGRGESEIRQRAETAGLDLFFVIR